MEKQRQFTKRYKPAGLITPSIGSLTAYILVTKPASVSLLVFTGVVGFALAIEGTFPPLPFIFLILSLTFSCAGANTLTGYLDRDIDAIMERTRKRPIPTMRISPGKALIFGLVLVMIALGFSIVINWLTFIIILAGVIINVVLYSLWTKRRTPFNIFIGGIAGALPVIGGYAAYAGTIKPEVLILGSIIFLWIPVHIWSIALKYSKDYYNAGVPMLPTIISEKRTVQLIALMSGLLVLLSLVPVLFGWFDKVYLYTATILGGILLALALWLMLDPAEKRSWLLFKVSSPYLGLLFTSVLVESLVKI